MARFLPLNVFLVSCLTAQAGLSLSALRAQAPMMEATNAAPAPAAVTAPIPAAIPGATQPLTPAVVPPPENYLQQYRKILSPGDHPSYPYKLTLPASGFGELKIPDAASLEMRDKLEQLATLSDAEIRDHLEKWPPYTKMSLGDQGTMLIRVQQFRDSRTKMAQAKARQLGLLTLTPAQQAQFEHAYWTKSLQMDHQLAKQFEPAFKQARQKLNEDLFKEFSSPQELAKISKPAPSSVQPSPVLKPSQPLNGAK